jgi:hypothetical protein
MVFPVFNLSLYPSPRAPPLLATTQGVGEKRDSPNPNPNPNPYPNPIPNPNPKTSRNRHERRGAECVNYWDSWHGKVDLQPHASGKCSLVLFCPGLLVLVLVLPWSACVVLIHADQGKTTYCLVLLVLRSSWYRCCLSRHKLKLHETRQETMQGQETMQEKGIFAMEQYLMRFSFCRLVSQEKMGLAHINVGELVKLLLSQ